MANHKIVVLDGHTENPGDLSWEGFESLGEFAVYDRTPGDKIAERIGDADIVYTNKTAITADTLDKCLNIKFIGVLATGYNVVDVTAAKQKGIPVANIPTYGTTAVAQFAFALLLEICHHVAHHAARVKDGEWARRGEFSFWDYPLIELADKTIGIIGFGRIGQNVARIAESFGMKVLAYDSYVIPEVAKKYKYVSLDELYASSDVISLHCPLFDSTLGMINKNSIAKMKDGVILLNTSRGPLIVMEDLAGALKSGKVYCAGLDVVDQEPIGNDNPLLPLENCIITPHIAWAPKESRLRLMNIAVDNLKAFLNGNPINIVNK